MRTKAVRPFPGPKVDRLPSGFAKMAISEACKPGGLPRTELTRISGQNCKWSLYLDEIAKGAGCCPQVGNRLWANDRPRRP